MELNDKNQYSGTIPEGILVKAPSVYQGVSDALRAVYAPLNNQLPDDWHDLLEQLR